MIELILALGVILLVGNAILIAQMIVLTRIFKSSAWLLLAAGFIVTGGRALWGFIKLPSAMLRAIAENRLPVALSVEQWVLLITQFIAMGLLIVGLDWLRRDLKRIGY